MNEDPRRRAWYEKERELYATASNNHLERFEKALLIASGGGFAGTASAVVTDPSWLNAWIILSFPALGLSFLCILFGHYFSHLSNEKAIDWLDANYMKDSTEFSSKFAKTVHYLNIASIVFLILGFALILMTGTEIWPVKKIEAGQHRLTRAPEHEDHRILRIAAVQARTPLVTRPGNPAILRNDFAT